MLNFYNNEINVEYRCKSNLFGSEILNSAFSIPKMKNGQDQFHPSMRNQNSEWTKNGFLSIENDTMLTNKNQSSIRPRKKRNIMSFTMKRIDNDVIQSSELAASDSPTSISSFACRADVIYKKILRDFRRYYINSFNETTGYKESKRGKGKEFSLQMLYKYVDNVFGEDLKNKEDITFTLGSLIFPNNFSKTSLGKKKKSKKEICKIHDTLYKFSISKVDKLFEDKYVGFLMYHFLNQPTNTNELIGLSKISEESYTTAFNLIRSRVEASALELRAK